LNMQDSENWLASTELPAVQFDELATLREYVALSFPELVTVIEEDETVESDATRIPKSTVSASTLTLIVCNVAVRRISAPLDVTGRTMSANRHQVIQMRCLQRLLITLSLRSAVVASQAADKCGLMDICFLPRLLW
jgi:hypothetical protein